MRESLIKANNQKLRKLLQKATGNKFKALLTGILTTFLIQSSSGVTAIVVALMGANILSLSQGVMVMIGSNIGTTTTAFIFTLHIEKYSLLFVIIGYFFMMFKKRKLQNLGNILIGFGFLFLGIDIMNIGFERIIGTNLFTNLLFLLSNNRFTALLGGTLISAAIQSSSATIGISQTLYELNSITIKVAVSIMLGANIGTTIASLIAAVSASKEAKAAVYVNIFFNLVGALLFLIFLDPFCDVLGYLEVFIKDKKMTIAYAHLLFNIISTIVFYFIFDKIVRRTDQRLFVKNN
ncbi:MAG: Na/Pi cotransporter family protein [Acholeplasmataceae bacterium]|nr:Na/Pi cotransporter family protein [Acholeplasmataceae bacterium]